MIDPIKKNVLMLAVRAGEIMLRSGSEIYRVEDTMTRICKAYGIPYVEVFTTTTGIFLSLDSEEEESLPYTIIKRTHRGVVDLEKISRVNEFSRQLTADSIPLEKSMELLNGIAGKAEYPFLLRVLGGALIASFVTLMMGAGAREFACAIAIGGSAYIVSHLFNKLRFNLFIGNFLVCVLISFLALLTIHWGLATNKDAMIVGSLTMFLPGLAITNAMRDSLAGDLVAGSARAMEASLIAISIASGVGFALFIWASLGGVL